jgi:hypothetical protein
VVTIQGKAADSFRVPPDTPLGELLWHETDDAWIDFTVRPLVDAKLTIDGRLNLELASNLSRQADATVRFGDRSEAVTLVPGVPASLRFPLDSVTEAAGEAVDVARLEVTAGDLSVERRWWLKAEESIRFLAPLPGPFEA